MNQARPQDVVDYINYLLKSGYGPECLLIEYRNKAQYYNSINLQLMTFESKGHCTANGFYKWCIENNIRTTEDKE